jgi:NADH-quinone oxidoreductase subunit E
VIPLANTLTKTEIQGKLKDVFSHYHGEKQDLIPVLQETQAQFRYLPAEALLEISRFLHIAESTIYGVCTFYAQFKLKPQGRKTVKICRGTACHVRGGPKVLDETEKILKIKAGETTEDMEYSLETIACFGSCALAPVMVIDEAVYGRMAPNKVKGVITGKE